MFNFLFLMKFEPHNIFLYIFIYKKFLKTIFTSYFPKQLSKTTLNNTKSFENSFPFFYLYRFSSRDGKHQKMPETVQ